MSLPEEDHKLEVWESLKEKLGRDPTEQEFQDALDDFYEIQAAIQNN